MRLNISLGAPLPATLTIIPTDTTGATVPAGPDDYRLSYLTDTGRTYADALEIPFTIPANAREFTFTLEAIDSMNVGHDRDKTLLLELSANTGIVDLDVTQRGVTIRDKNPAPIFSFEEIDYSVNEGESLTFTVEVVGAASYTQTLSLVPYLPPARAVKSDQAIDRDLALSPTIVTIPADSDGSSPISRFEFTLTANEDDIYEGTESTTLNVVLQDDNGNQVDQDIRYVNIIDNELFPTLSLDPIGDVTEGGVFTGTVRISSALESPLLISELRYVPTGSTAEMDDYRVPGNFPLARITSGKTTGVIAFPYEAIPDGIYEGTETLILRPLGFDNDRIGNLPGSSSEITIIDGDDIPTVSLISLGQVREGNDLAITARLSGPLDSAVTVELRAVSGSADDTDYDIPTTTTTLSAGATTTVFILETDDDNVYEGDKTLILELSASTTNGEELGRITSSITIIESRPQPTVELRLVDGRDSFNEGEMGIQIEAYLTDILDVPVTVSLMTGATSTAEDEDYELSSQMAQIVAGTTSTIFTLNIKQDEVYEGDEQFGN